MKQILLILTILIFTAQVGYCAYDPATGEEIKGYKGELPDVTERFQKYLPQTAHPQVDSVDAFNKSRGYKPAPRENPTYVNVIVKKDKVSQFTNDINELIPYVEKMISSIENKESEQLFAARANSLYDSVQVFKSDYAEKPEHYYPVYDALIEVTSRVKGIVSIRNEAMVYSSYLPYQSEGYMYNPAYINQQLSYILRDFKYVLKLMREVE